MNHLQCYTVVDVIVENKRILKQDFFYVGEIKRQNSHYLDKYPTPENI